MMERGRVVMMDGEMIVGGDAEVEGKVAVFVGLPRPFPRP